MGNKREEIFACFARTDTKPALTNHEALKGITGPIFADE